MLASVDPAIEMGGVRVERDVGDAERLEAARPRELCESNFEVGRRWIGKVHARRPV
jgi:hypothetical protein